VIRTSFVYASLMLAALVPTPAVAQQASAPTVKAVAAMPPTDGDPNQAVMIGGAGDTATLLGTAKLGGLVHFTLDGRRTGSDAAGEVVGVDARATSPLGDAAIVVTADAKAGRLHYFAATNGALKPLGDGEPFDFAVEGVCLARGPSDSALYAITVGDGGEIAQDLLYATADGSIASRRIRRLHLPSKIKFCVGDDRAGAFYVAEQQTGIWRFSSDPEADAAPALIDSPRLGHLGGEVAGLALHDDGKAAWLIASDAGAGQLRLYDLAKDGAYRGAIAVARPDGSAIKEASGLSVAAAPGQPQGALIVTDHDNKVSYALVDWAAVASTLHLPPGGPPIEVAPKPRFATVTARVETRPVGDAGDAADDPAIWADPADPSRSLILGTDKRAGLYLYDMNGAVVDFLAAGKLNNIDLRDGFALDGKRVVLAAATDRTNKTIRLFMLDTERRKIVDIGDGPQPSGLGDPYGVCIYKSVKSGRFYVIASDTEGLNRQWEIVARPGGRAAIKQVRDLHLGSQTEGCVADDANAKLYIDEEDVALWQFNAEPGGSDRGRQIGTVADNPALAADLEGVSLYDLGGGRGYLVASSQGNNSYAVYRREGDNAYLGSFAVIADGVTGIDGISETDGLDLSSRPLGPGFEAGAMVAQDGRNVLPDAAQNFKIVRWADIAAALHLETRNTEGKD
jgi:3-phytase